MTVSLKERAVDHVFVDAVLEKLVRESEPTELSRAIANAMRSATLWNRERPAGGFIYRKGGEGLRGRAGPTRRGRSA